MVWEPLVCWLGLGGGHGLIFPDWESVSYSNGLGVIEGVFGIESGS